MDINKFDVVVWVRKTNSFPTLRDELLRLAGNDRTSLPATRAWSIFTGASLISPTPSTWPLLSARWPPGPTSCFCNSATTTT